MDWRQYFLKAGSYLPMIVMFILIGIVYILYCTVQSISNQVNPLTIRHTYIQSFLVHIFQDQLFYFNSRHSCGKMKLYKKTTLACIEFVLLHLFMLMLFISIFKTMYQSPGNVPQTWLDSINQEVQEYLQNENEITIKIKEDMQKQRLSEKQYRKSLPGYSLQNVSAESSDNFIQDSFQNQSSEQIRNQNPKGQTINSIKLILDPSEVSAIQSNEFNENAEFKDDQSEINEQIRIQLNMKAKLELIDKKGRRFCKNCFAFKPQRTHHCSQCYKCVLKMDHHCQWVNNCIGFYNYKYFFNMIFYFSVVLIFIVCTYTSFYYEKVNSDIVSDLQLYTVTLLYYFCILMMVIICSFTVFHLWLMSKNYTTLEFLEKKEDSVVNIQFFFTYIYQRGVYNLSCFKNLQAALGSNPLFWFIPACIQFLLKKIILVPNNDGYGLDFKLND